MSEYYNNFRAGVSTGGNTAGTTGTVLNQAILVGGANITLSESRIGAGRATITIVGGAGGGGGTGVAISAAGNSVSDQTVVFSNSNGLAFGMAGSTVTGSYTVPTVTNSSWTVSDAASSATVGRLAFTNLNGVTLSLSTGAAGSHTIVGSHNALTSQSNQNAVGSNGNFNFQTISFSNAGGVTFSTSAGSAIVASVNTSYRASNDAVGLNTAQTNVTWTVNSSGISINAAGYAGTGTSATNASITLNSNGLAISVGAGGGGAFSAGVSNVGNTAGATGVTGTRLVFVGTNNITLSQTTDANGGTISISGAGGGAGQFSGGVSTGGNTAGATGITGTRLVFVGSSPLSLSQTTDANGGTITFNAPATSSLSATGAVSISTNGSTISIGAPAGGTVTLSKSYDEAGYGSLLRATQEPGNGSIKVWPIEVGNYFSFSKFLLSVSASISTSTNSSHGGTLSMGVGFYTRNVSTLSLATSGLATLAWTNTSNNSTASLSGLREVSGTFANMALTPGDYWLAVWSRTSTVNANWITLSNIYHGSSDSNSTHSGSFGAAAGAASFQPGIPGNGTFSATSAALPVSMAFSHITGTARWWMRPHIAFRNFDG